MVAEASEVFSLGINSTGKGVDLAIIDNQGNQYSQGSKSELQGQGSEQMLVSLERLLKTASLEFSQVNEIVVASGPGSFSGIRTGLAAAAGLQLASGSRLIAEPILYTSALEPNNKSRLAIVSEANPDQYFCAFLGLSFSDPEKIGSIFELSEPCCLNKSEFSSYVETIVHSRDESLADYEIVQHDLGEKVSSAMKLIKLARIPGKRSKQVIESTAIASMAQPLYIKKVNAKTIAERQAAYSKF